MEQITNHYHINQPLNFSVASGEPITVQVVDLSLTHQDDELVEGRLALQVTPDLFQVMQDGLIFNLTPEIFGPDSTVTFLPEHQLTLEVCLRPDLLPNLAQLGENGEAIATQLLTHSDNPEATTLLSAENWFCLSVAQPEAAASHKTLWAYLDFKKIVQNGLSKEAFGEALLDFYTAEIHSNLDTPTSALEKEFFERLVKTWLQVEISGAGTDDAHSEEDDDGTIFELLQGFIEEIASSVASTATGANGGTDARRSRKRAGKRRPRRPDNKKEKTTPGQFAPTSSGETIFEQIVNYFKAENWHFTQINDLPLLCLRTQGQNGEWMAYARAIEENRQFIFYSLIPAKASPEKSGRVAEFIARSNCDMAIGNFELNYDTGEIRYKTSIDVRGTTLGQSLIENLVYTNVAITDRYLPGIMSVIYTDIAPAEAIAGIEST